jgi:hypothetical protein
MEQNIFTLSMITVGATENVLQFKMSAANYSKNFCVNEQKMYFFNTVEKLKQSTISIIQHFLNVPSTFQELLLMGIL